MAISEAGWELGNRRYIREKVVTLYEDLFQLPSTAAGVAPRAVGEYVYSPPRESLWRELFLLKVNRLWLQQCIQSMTEEEILGARRPLLRDVFARCTSALHTDDTQIVAHALETMCALISGLSYKAFNDPGSDTMEVFCGLNDVEDVMEDLLGSLQAHMLSGAPDCQRQTVTAMLTLSCLTTNINQNILLEFLIGHGLAEDIVALMRPSDAAQRDPALGMQVMKLVVLMSTYHKYETGNVFLRALKSVTTPSDLADVLGPARAALAHIVERGGGQSSTSGLVASLSVEGAGSAVYWALQRSLKVLTLDPLVSESRHSLETSSQAAVSSEVLAAGLCIYEVVHCSPALLGLSFVAKPQEAHNGNGMNGDREKAASRSEPRGVKGGALESQGAVCTNPSYRGTPHCSIVRNLLSLTSLVALDARRPQAQLVLRLCLLTLTTATSSTKNLEAFHAANLGGSLVLWRAERGIPVARQTAEGCSLAGVLLETVTLVLMQNLRKSLPAETFHAALLAVQQIVLWQVKSSMRMADAPWRQLFHAVVQSLLFCSSNADVPDGDSPGSWLGLCLQHMVVINLFLVHGAAFLPEAHLQQQLAYEIVRLHHAFEKLFRVGQLRDPSGRVTDALALVRRIIVLTLDKLDTPRGPSHSQAQVMNALREIQLEVEPQMAAALHKWHLPPENPAHVPFFQAVSRSLVTSFREDESRQC